MSETSALGGDFVGAAREALRAGTPEAVPEEALRAVLRSAVRLYAARVEATGAYPAPVDIREVMPTDIVVIASEMLRAADLNLFDLAMWYRRAR
ncbi:MAG TPA: hypothetical protein VLJ20_05520 [Acetobacteraceae bacterium]|nr:hypothetical protein [Acetobacteraceae bacterium]